MVCTSRQAGWQRLNLKRSRSRLEVSDAADFAKQIAFAHSMITECLIANFE